MLVDYAQLISIKSERLTDEAKLATIARQLKNIAKEYIKPNPIKLARKASKTTTHP